MIDNIMKSKALKPEEHYITEEPYYQPIGQEIRVFETAYKQQLPVLLKGPTGCGKTRFMERMFMTVGTATVSTSAEEAKSLGFLRRTDRITLNPDAVLADAKADVLALAQMGYQPPAQYSVPVPGTTGIAALKVGVHGMRQGGYLSEYDEHLGTVLATVLCGGEVAAGTLLSEQDFLELEREAFVGLCREQKTIDRILHMLETGKPLRN